MLRAKPMFGAYMFLVFFEMAILGFALYSVSHSMDHKNVHHWEHTRNETLIETNLTWNNTNQTPPVVSIGWIQRPDTVSHEEQVPERSSAIVYFSYISVLLLAFFLVLKDIVSFSLLVDDGWGPNHERLPVNRLILWLLQLVNWSLFLAVCGVNFFDLAFYNNSIEDNEVFYKSVVECVALSFVLDLDDKFLEAYKGLKKKGLKKKKSLPDPEDKLLPTDTYDGPVETENAFPTPPTTPAVSSV